MFGDDFFGLKFLRKATGCAAKNQQHDRGNSRKA
jgi:hypothetical protein